MSFQFENAVDFFIMSGHGPYVWASYAITFFAMMALVLVPLFQQKGLKVRIQRKQRIESANANKAGTNGNDQGGVQS
ncbi:MAG: heme exporter protein CcmD [Cellvibrionaceae bacterium]